MKTTGLIRRIDPLGRVVIPSEIRKTFSIMENDSLEISVEGDKICFQKYEPATDYIKHLKGISHLINDDNNLDNSMKEAICSGLTDAISMLKSGAEGKCQ